MGDIKCPEITVGCCVPPQRYDTKSKVNWLCQTLGGETKYDAFFLPQEWLGGHYATILADRHQKEMPLHWERSRVEDIFGKVAQEHKTAIGVGACIKREDGTQGGTEDYLYFDKDGRYCGAHRKFAHPAYDDIRSKGAGRLWAEDDFERRIRPIDIPTVGLRIGTVFCWEVYSRVIVPAYAFNDVNLLVHPIKFAPRGWLKKGEHPLYPDEVSIVGFDQDVKSQDWIQRLITVAHWEALCPIAISCNTWDIGAKFFAITGHVDPFGKPDAQPIVEVSSEAGAAGRVHTFRMNPKVYAEGINNAFSAGAFKEAVGDIKELGGVQKATMSIKMRRLEAHLIGGTTRMDGEVLVAKLQESVARRQKKSTAQRYAKLTVTTPPQGTSSRRQQHYSELEVRI